MESATTRAGGTRAQTDRPAGRTAVRRLTTETKQAFKTTEFWAMVVVIVGILAAAAMIKGGDTAPGTDEFIAKQAWLYVAIVAVGYMISRGLAKSGSRDPYDAERDDRDPPRH
jgi:di/tricarboxylate transporter